MLFILHTGQTGVERGAHDAARAAGLGIAGFMPIEQRDELAALPIHVTQRLTPCLERGHRPALRGNIQIASAALVIVPSSAELQGAAGMIWVVRMIRSHRIMCLVCDITTSAADVASWASSIPITCGSRRLLVTGPRATRWAAGESVARRFVTAIAAVAIGGDTAISLRS